MRCITPSASCTSIEPTMAMGRITITSTISSVSSAAALGRPLRLMRMRRCTGVNRIAVTTAQNTAL